MPRARLLLLSGLLVALAVPTGASASRAPSTTEAKAIFAVTTIDRTCARVRVSTKSAGWAVVEDRGGRRCGQERSVVLRRTARGAWQDHLTLGGSGQGFCPVEKVPTAVARDLGLCKPPPTLAKAGAVVLCMHAAADIFVMEGDREPATCNTRPQLTAEEIAEGLADGIEPEAPEAGANLSGLTWARWGSRRATATGIDLGFEATPGTTPVTVVATRPRFNDCANYTYTLMTVTYPDGRVVEIKNPARCVI
ncbi:MAG: hypothetical protein Q7T55_16725 [Solirubrobacteraceae bacterium]|nr:hypothetical protein [Solirubrobacteraceae bacterium]